MMTQIARPALPAGADVDPELNDDWQPEGYRCVWTPPVGPECIRGVVIQYADGSIGTEGSDAPLVYIGASEYTPAVARSVADSIHGAADLIESWAGRSTVEIGALLTSARGAVDRALQAVPGDASDRLRAALDCIDEAQAVTR